MSGGRGGAARPIVVAGYTIGWQHALAAPLPDSRLVFVDEPDVLRKRCAREHLSGLGRPWELVGWEYQRPVAADRFAVRHPALDPAAVIPGVEYAVPFAARLAERHGLPGAGLGAARILRDKWLLRQVTAAAGIANPVSRPVEGPAGVRRLLEETGAPVVLKPANRQASVGTLVIRRASEIPDAWEACTTANEGEQVPDRGLPMRMLVESFVAGEELSVEMLVRNGEALFHNVTAKRLFPGPHPVELGHAVPADIPADEADGLVGETLRVLRAVGFGTGFVHCEWIVGAGGVPHLVECAGRMPGDLIVPLIARAYGVDLVRAYLDVMRGVPATCELPRRPVTRTAVEFLAVRPGRVVRVDGVERARGLPGVLVAEVSARPGDRIGDLRSSWDRVGSVAAAAATTEEAVLRAREAVDQLVVETAMDGAGGPHEAIGAGQPVQTEGE